MSPRSLPPLARGAPHASAAAGGWSERFCFLLLVAIFAVRPLLPETFERTQLSFLRGMGELRGPSPATTAWLDSLLLIAALPLLLSPHERPDRRSGWPRVFGIGMVLLAASVALSTLFAGNARAALNAGAHLLCVLIAGAALLRAARRRGLVNLIVAAVLASGAASAYKCYAQVRWEFAQTLEAWTEYKTQLTQLGHDTEAPEIENYERRLRSGEAFGYQTNPNIAASCLVMCLGAAAGVLAAAIQRLVRGERNAAAAVVIVLLLAAAMLSMLPATGSVGAYVAAAAALCVFIALISFRPIAMRRPRLMLALLIAPYVALVAAGISYGMVRGTLPHASLAFRWQYWTAGAAAAMDAPLTGVGRENFGAAYLLHKRPEATEEVKNAHDLWMTLLVELGPLGLLGGCLVALAAVRGALGEPQPGCTREPVHPASGDGSWFLNGTIAALLTLGLHAILSGQVLDLSSAFVWTIELAGAFGVAMYFVLNALWSASTADDGPLLSAGLTAGVAAALVHNLVCFSLFTPAGLSLCVALSAAAIAAQRRAPDATVSSSRAPSAGSLARLAMCVLLPAAHVVCVTAPTALSETMEQRVALLAGRAPELRELLAAADAAAAVDPLDAQGLRTAARTMAGLSMLGGLPDDERVKWLLAARETADRALRREPTSHTAWVLLAQVNERLEDPLLNLARPGESAEALHGGVDAWDRAVELYPSNPRTRISAAEAHRRLWDETLETADGQAAVAHFCAALAIDDSRPPQEVMRLRPAERDRIQRGLDALCTAGLESPCGNGRR
ncbi:O-Antigen ligase [Phycisphaerae bacterium RAS1]|nr:O-Antigen ligase [Phycisphaerae bacterium RAS1]